MVLGLQVDGALDRDLVWHRSNEVPKVEKDMSRRELFSLCGLLVGHYPVAGWLRVACAYVKRCSEGTSWEDSIGNKAMGMVLEMLRNVDEADPVCGKWNVTSKNGKVWCDASSLALGCALEIDGSVVEDGAWLRKKADGAHINVAELDSVVRGLIWLPNGTFRTWRSSLIRQRSSVGFNQPYWTLIR